MKASLQEHEELVESAAIGDMTVLERATDGHWPLSAKRTQRGFRSDLKKSAEPRNGNTLDSKG